MQSADVGNRRREWVEFRIRVMLFPTAFRPWSLSSWNPQAKSLVSSAQDDYLKVESTFAASLWDCLVTIMRTWPSASTVFDVPFSDSLSIWMAPHSMLLLGWDFFVIWLRELRLLKNRWVKEIETGQMRCTLLMHYLYILARVNSVFGSCVFRISDAHFPLNSRPIKK